MTTHLIKAGPDTVQGGIIDPRARPIRTIMSGDTVVLDTWTMWDNAGGASLDLAGALALRDRFRGEGRGPHTLTGPIAVETAEPGDMLKVEILRLDVADHGLNIIFPGSQSRALLADIFPDAELRHFPLDRATMTTRFGDSITIPLRPFLGIMGVLPPGDTPRHSAIPGVFGGNIDCSDLVAGTVLYLPVFVPGAGFYAGDAHAVQGSGEVVQTALETAMTAAELRLTVIKGRTIRRPWAETPDHFITMGLDEDLREAARQAVLDMVELLSDTKGMKPSDAYALCSLQADLLVTQVVNGTNGIHARMPKAIFGDRTPSATTTPE
ncbi:acetamidase/formamidase family protein [Bradyrhizobium sp. U87765 SZCCT0131]|uniref:acetamidase/formamidase family protein n=1 Tax=unclassified Bradyrhizobium TaxID=2631580 RepID=UPI001BA740A7|nr:MULTISPECIES: acetamidase/formamidase family protein [unclassified Bradyrhizobium]MBR1221605.1 acetamidase/formamidase family protein [Bradyrhizobium sp. U87765 SZCCT0131]MBR1264472.1 acetamidase/formamidase family protein [Bradyrhizobium sp. U87765 SZCCT0134]MBR1304621.1 acetamidase/formamidase family protein [Bradyrhizobium sp. U87765 SZCCT0110]MBR1322522.1 acetamidase/formamidase family protein [Bradyrhizobium sp. U87765 SZCCT0109]MBR1346550.1 acetamidase/formamidase family protein [Brad